MKNLIKLPIVLAAMSLSLVACQTEEFGLKELSTMNMEVLPADDPRIVCPQILDQNECEQNDHICGPSFDEVPGSDEFTFAQCVPLPDPRIVDIESPSNDVEPTLPEQNDPISNIGNPVNDEIARAVASNCQDVPEEFLIRKGRGQPQVIICHNANGKRITISPACPSLKAHIGHDDTIGPCL